jgi:hypothetical protein
MFRALVTHLQEALHNKTLAILRSCFVSWLHQDWSGNSYNVVHQNFISITQIEFISVNSEISFGVLSSEAIDSLKGRLDSDVIKKIFRLQN